MVCANSVEEVWGKWKNFSPICMISEQQIPKVENALFGAYTLAQE